MTNYALPHGPVHVRYAGPPDGPRVLFVHGLIVNGSLWDPVVERVKHICRCVIPDLPLGSHALPLRPRVDRSPTALAQLLADLIVELDLKGTTIVANDTGGALTQLLLARQPELAGALVLTPCDAFENFLPPLFRPLQGLAHSRVAVDVLLQGMRVAPVRQATYRTLSSTVSAAQTGAWVKPAQSSGGIRADLRATLTGIDPRETLWAAPRLAAFTGRAKVVWPQGARIFPFEHAERFARIMPNAELVPVAPGRSFIPLDQPEPVAKAILDVAT